MEELDKMIRLKFGAWRKLRKLAAGSNEQLGELVTRLIEAEWERVKLLEANAAQWQAQP